MTTFFQFKNTPVSVSDYHHEVLELWAEVKRSSPERSLGTVTLDHHTDVVQAFRGAKEVVPGAWKSKECVLDAIAQLKHDEHIDWALQSGLTDYAKVIAHVNETTPANGRIELLFDPKFPDELTQLNEPEKFYLMAKNVLDDSFLTPLLKDVPSGAYILDIDCDNFLCRDALFPQNSKLWHNLIRHATAISVSLESDYVRILKFRNENITAEEIADHLLSLFETLLA